MATLPTLDTETPIKPATGDLRYPSHIANPGVVGEAISRGGEQMEKQGIADAQAQNQDEFATARANFLVHKSELEANLKGTPDWKNAEGTYRSSLADAQAAAAATITDPKTRQKFNETSAIDTAQGLPAVREMVNGRQRDQDGADLDTLTTANMNTALASPQNAPGLISSTSDAIDAAVKKGTITAEDGVKRRQVFSESYGKSWFALQKPEDQVRILTSGAQQDQLPTPDVAPGNIDIHNRPVVKNADGTISTVRTISIGTDKGEVVIPTVVGGKVVSNDDAIAHYKQTGENFGTFKSEEAANAFAEALHKQQANEYGGASGAAPKGDIKTALIGQESHGDPNVPDSPTGAMGVGQIEPETWKRFAKPGEDPHNAKDNAAVSGRYVDYLSGLPNVKGDPARIAVGYYSGEGNIAPLGSSTPYKKDVGPRKGVKGPTTSQYVSQVMGRMGGSGVALGSRDSSPVAITGTPADFIPLPERAALLREAQTAVRADQAGSRAAFADRARDTIDFLHAGGDATKAGITPDQVRQTIPDEEGAQLADGLQHAIDYSGAVKRLATAPESDIEGIIAGKMPQGPEGFRASSAEAGALIKAAKDRQTQIYGTDKTPGDPVSYVTANFPDVAKAYVAGQKDPTKFGDYVKKVRGAQVALGISPEAQRILPTADAQAIVHQLQTGDPKSAVADLMGLEKQAGGAWPQVYSDLARAGLPASFQALAVVKPQDAQTMAAALGKDADSKAKGAPMAEAMRGVKFDQGDGKAPKSVTDLVEQQLAHEPDLASLRSSYGVFGRTGAQSFDGVYDAVRTTALYLFQTRGISPKDAATQATAMVTGQFDFVQQPGHAPLRLPKGQTDNFQAAASSLVDGLKPKDLKPLPTEQDDQGREIAGRPEAERADQALTHAKSAYWISVPGADGRGAARAIDPQSDTPILRANGKPLDIPLAQLATLATAASKQRAASQGTAFAQSASGFGR